MLVLQRAPVTAPSRRPASRRRLRVSAASPAADLLAAVEGSDAGAAADAPLRARVLELATRAEAAFALSGADPRSSPLLFGDYRVAYSSSTAAAGGRFRTRLGRAIFRTHALYQNVLPPDLPGSPPRVVNRVEFLLFGVPGAISLAGTLRPVEPLTVVPRNDVAAGEGAAASSAAPRAFGGAVEVQFQPARLALAGAELSLGGASSVRLATTYLDERLRIGRGGFGSLFLFSRCRPGEQDAAALPVPARLRAAGPALVRTAAAAFSLLSVVADFVRLAVSAARQPPVAAAALASLAALLSLRSGVTPLITPLLPPPLAAAAHLLCLCAWLGALTWVSFGQGDLLFRYTARHALSALRRALRPRLLLAGSFLGSAALLLAPAAGLRGAAACWGLALAVACNTVAMVWVEAEGSRLAAFRDKLEAEQGIGAEVGAAPAKEKRTPALERLGERLTRLRAGSVALAVVAMGGLACHVGGLGARLALLA